MPSIENDQYSIDQSVFVDLNLVFNESASTAKVTITSSGTVNDVNITRELIGPWELFAEEKMSFPF